MNFLLIMNWSIIPQSNTEGQSMTLCMHCVSYWQQELLFLLDFDLYDLYLMLQLLQCSSVVLRFQSLIFFSKSLFFQSWLLHCSVIFMLGLVLYLIYHISNSIGLLRSVILYCHYWYVNIEKIQRKWNIINSVYYYLTCCFPRYTGTVRRTFGCWLSRRSLELWSL